MDDATQGLVRLMMERGFLTPMSHYATPEEFRESRRELYRHDAERYPMYFEGPDFAFGFGDNAVLPVDTTTALSQVLLAEAATGGRAVDRVVLEALARREDRAVTYALFASDPALAQSERMAGELRRRVSTAYTRHYLQVGGGDIPTGIAGVAFYDSLSIHFPVFDLTLLAEVLVAIGVRDVTISDAKTVEMLATARGTPDHAELRRRIAIMAVALGRWAGADRRVDARGVVSSRMVALIREASAGEESSGSLDAYWVAPAIRRLEVLRANLGRRRDVVQAFSWAEEALGLGGCDVLILVATKVERDSMLEAIRGLSVRTEPKFIGSVTYFDCGIAGGAHVCLVQCEMGSGGPGGSLMTAKAACDALKPAAIVMAGIGFGTRPDKHEVGTIIVSKQLRLYEAQRIGTDSDGGVRVVLRGDLVTASPALLARFRAMEESSPIPVEFGTLLTGEKLIDNSAWRDALVAEQPDAIGGEMEGSGLYVAASEAGIPWIVVKAICDWADGSKKTEREEEWQELAARNAAQLVVAAIRAGAFQR